MRNLIKIGALLGFIILVGCKDSSTNNTTTTGSNSQGTLRGMVVLHDTITDPEIYDGAIIADASGITVSLEGTSYSTTTNANGEWEINGVPAGTYKSLMFSKTGMAPYKEYQYPTEAFIVGANGIQYIANVDLYRLSNASVNLILRAFQDYTQFTRRDTLISDPSNPNSYYVSTVYDTVRIPFGATYFSSKILDAAKNGIYYYSCELFFSVSPNIDPLDPKTYLLSSAQNNSLQNVDAITGNIDFDVIKTQLYKAGFKSGQTVYCVAYCCRNVRTNSAYSSYGYIDPPTNIFIFSNLSPNHSEVKSFILP